MQLKETPVSPPTVRAIEKKNTGRRKVSENVKLIVVLSVKNNRHNTLRQITYLNGPYYRMSFCDIIQKD